MRKIKMEKITEEKKLQILKELASLTKKNYVSLSEKNDLEKAEEIIKNL